MLVGFNALDPDFDADEKTGGEKAHTLTAAEMPVHTHVQDQHRHQTLRERSAVTGAAATQIARTADTSSTVDTGVFTEYTTPTNQNAGSGAAHNNLPPYIAVHLWKRTA
jgi:microcystin-dependent protein